MSPCFVSKFANVVSYTHIYFVKIIILFFVRPLQYLYLCIGFL